MVVEDYIVVCVMSVSTQGRTKHWWGWGDEESSSEQRGVLHRPQEWGRRMWGGVVVSVVSSIVRNNKESLKFL